MFCPSKTNPLWPSTSDLFFRGDNPSDGHDWRWLQWKNLGIDFRCARHPRWLEHVKNYMSEMMIYIPEHRQISKIMGNRCMEEISCHIVSLPLQRLSCFAQMNDAFCLAGEAPKILITRKGSHTHLLVHIHIDIYVYVHTIYCILHVCNCHQHATTKTTHPNIYPVVKQT